MTDFVLKFLVHQQTKYNTQAPTGFLQPLPTLEVVLEDLMMDFITNLPLSKGYMVILVVVDSG